MSERSDYLGSPKLLEWAFGIVSDQGQSRGCLLGAVLLLTVDDEIGDDCRTMLRELAEGGRGVSAAAAYIIHAACGMRDRIDLPLDRELQLLAVARAHGGMAEVA